MLEGEERKYRIDSAARSRADGSVSSHDLRPRVSETFDGLKAHLKLSSDFSASIWPKAFSGCRTPETLRSRRKQPSPCLEVTSLAA